MKYIFLPLFIFFYSFFQHPETVDLKVTITNIETIKGDIKIGVFNDKETFLTKGEEYKTYSKKVKGNTVVFLLKGLEKDDYAITIYHDVNSDNECNLNFLGIPTEPYGFSNNYKPRISKPSFNDCKVELNKSKAISIELID